MKQFWKEVGLAIVLGMLMPGIILNIVTYSARKHTNDTEKPNQAQSERHDQTWIRVKSADGNVSQMDLEEYLTGVVLAEMPASFDAEALKAQAVVARTYTLRAHEGKSKHPDAAVCTDPACCQAYRTAASYEREGGSRENLEKVRSAVADTAGLVLTYEGALIEATYFSCSGGMTEDAVAVWGTEVPYLQSVSSPGEEGATYYTDSMTFSYDRLRELLGLSAGDGEIRFADMEHTAGGGVASLTIDGRSFQGTELRKLLNLRSTAFTIVVDDGQVTFHTRGFGHRVGMSQYGADAMAVSGYQFQEILQHYYPGTILEGRSVDKQ